MSAVFSALYFLVVSRSPQAEVVDRAACVILVAMNGQLARSWEGGACGMPHVSMCWCCVAMLAGGRQVLPCSLCRAGGCPADFTSKLLCLAKDQH